MVSVGEEPAPSPVVSRRVASRWLVFGIVSVALFMGSMDQTIVATALPTLQHKLHARLSWASWSITGYSLGTIVALPIMGRIGDQFGRRRVFLIMIAVFTASSLACGLATNIYMLVGLRIVQSLGGGAFMPVATGIVADRFAGDRDRAIGLFTSIFPLGSMTGPVLGGLLISVSSWRAVFLINVPIGCLLIAVGGRFLPFSAPKQVHRADVRGAVLLGVAIVSLMYGITTLGAPHSRLFGPGFILPELLALASGAAFTRHMRVVEFPIIPVHLLRRRTFLTMNVVSLIYGGAALGFASLVPLYAEDRYHFAPLQAGTILSVRAIGSILVAGATSFLLRRIGYRLPMVLGFALCAVGLCLLYLAPPEVSTFAWLAIGATVMGLGAGISSPVSSNALLSQAPDEIGAVSGLRGMFRQGGGIFAVAVTTAVAGRSATPGLAIAHSLLIFGAFLVFVTIPLVLTVPEHRGTW